ncbi:hypothetical protein FIBSPDRAFT_402380 [Athelia psychrophila]|uniref:Uncharacterized protein n=1 Tax=Athelia psychrophila TaxID=1759441 RepID=A0A166NHH4_9AGAM|nr:hypothetical protein FIBSPDRAFT_402380 [Fibularhizoctonia sp. CBS 109695]
MIYSSPVVSLRKPFARVLFWPLSRLMPPRVPPPPVPLPPVPPSPENSQPPQHWCNTQFDSCYTVHSRDKQSHLTGPSAYACEDGVVPCGCNVQHTWISTFLQHTCDFLYLP